MEKTISDFKVSETDGGFRIDIKGNKEAMRRMLSGFDFCNSFKAGAPFASSSHACSDFMSGFASWCGSWEQPKEKSQSASPKGATTTSLNWSCPRDERSES